MYNNKLFNMCLRKSDTDKTIVEPPSYPPALLDFAHVKVYNNSRKFGGEFSA